MINEGRCKNVRPVITEQDCMEMQQREARICNDCTAPAAVVVDLDAGLAAAVAALPAGRVEVVTEAVVTRTGFFVDFSGHEELLERFRDAAASRGMEAEDCALDLVYLFDAGLLRLAKEV